ncbi:M23 family metallopeptidase [Devosia sp.]|uniref:M23 family metallopeptidase n=1 Tax=Devosia sp. TaxID=1871048 RepID=UPI0032645995
MRKQSGFARSNGDTLAPPQPARSHGIRPALFYSMFAILLAGNALTATAFLLAPDIASLLSGQNDQVVNAYEDRIDQLRIEVDRLHSRSYAQAGDLNLQLQELSQQQELLVEQHQLVKVLVGKAQELGIDAVAPEPAAAPVAADDPGIDPIITGNAEVDATAKSISDMMGETRYAMSAISESATEKTDGIVAGLADIGIKAALPTDDEEDGVGGPLLPPVDGDPESSSLIADANSVMSALVRYKAARGAIDAAPVHMPISGQFRRSSGFGNRTDPFTGGRAFHAGLDFAAPSGSTVLSAGSGVVSFVGQRSGYGNVVEITHSSGIVTRYGHLSAFLATEGQAVTTGMPIAKVGSTGRSTGPHLHFEVRRDDNPINPDVYLSAGKKLLQLLG